MNNIVTYLLAAARFGSMPDYILDSPLRTKHEPGRVIRTGTYRRTFGEGHSRVERQMRRQERHNRLAEVKARKG